MKENDDSSFFGFTITYSKQKGFCFLSDCGPTWVLSFNELDTWKNFQITKKIHLNGTWFGLPPPEEIKVNVILKELSFEYLKKIKAYLGYLKEYHFSNLYYVIIDDDDIDDSDKRNEMVNEKLFHSLPKKDKEELIRFIKDAKEVHCETFSSIQ